LPTVRWDVALVDAPFISEFARESYPSAQEEEHVSAMERLSGRALTPPPRALPFIG